ncbi:MAG: hypothetical protein U0Q11_18490 [Vicinamibacterales bacterium]
MAIVAHGLATLLHEGVGHGVVAWLRGDTVTELTSNHLSSLNADAWVQAGGTVVNAVVGIVSMLAAARAARGQTRYFLWLFGALNLLPAAGYFLLSGVAGFGDWHEVTKDLPQQTLVRVAMTAFGALAYFLVVRWLAAGARPFVSAPGEYNSVGRLPYYVAGVFSAVAGAFDPLGIELLFISTIPAAFGGLSGLMWADSLMPASSSLSLRVPPSRTWWIGAALFGIAYVVILGRGVSFAH